MTRSEGFKDLEKKGFKGSRVQVEKDRGLETEDRSQKSGDRRQKTEDRRQETEDRRQKRVRRLEGWRCSEKTERRGKTK